MKENSLKDRTVKGTFWSAADAFLGQGVTFLVGILLARLLSPAEYGLIGICTIFTTVLFGVVDSGFSTALIRRKDVTNDDYNTMFITNMAMSVLMFVGLYAVAPWVALFFERSELTPILRVMGLVLIIQALSITQVTILSKRIDFKTKAKASLFSAVCSGVIGIVMAFSGFGVWSLVGQQLSKQTLYTVVLWVLNRWWPKLRFSKNSFRYMWGFGWKMMLSGLLNNIWNQLYQVVVGKCYSPSTLGQYTRAKEYASLFSLNFTAIIQRVTYPAMAELQDDRVRLVSAYRKIIKDTMFVTTCCMIPLGAISGPLIYCLIGPQWNEAAAFLPLICISSSLYPLHAINLNMLQVQGRSDLFLYIEIIKKVVSLFPISLGIFVGIYSMLVASIFAGLIGFFLNSYYTGKRLNYSSLMQLKDVAPSYVISLNIAIPIYFLKYLPFSNWFILPIQMFLGLLLFFIINEFVKISEYIELKEIIKENGKKVLNYFKQ